MAKKKKGKMYTYANNSKRKRKKLLGKNNKKQNDQKGEILAGI